MRILIFVMATMLTFSTVAADLPLNVGDTAPDWTLENKDGESVNFYEDSKDKVSVILFWATWCPYCRTLMPHLEVTYRKYRSKGLKFYAIDVFEDGKIDPIEYFDQKKFSYTLIKDGDSVAEKYGAKGTPGVYVIDKNKQIIYKRPSGVSDVLVQQNVNLRIKQALSK